MRLRKIAAVSTLALTAAGIAAVTPTANAALATTPYSCTAPLGADTLGPYSFDTSATSTLAAAKTYGQKATSTVSVGVGADVMDLARLMKASKVSGKVTALAKSNGKSATFTAPVPATPIPASGGLTATAKGTLPALGAGKQVLTLPSYKLDMTVTLETGPLTLNFTCAPAAGTNTTVDTVTVAKATTTSAVKATGLKKSAKIVVNVKAKFGTKAGGKVTVKVGKKSKTVAVKAGKATVTLKGLKKGKNKVVVSYKGDANHVASTKSASVKVK